MVMRETLVGFQGGLQIGGRIVTNLRYADDIILLAISEAELQELVDYPDRQVDMFSYLGPLLQKIASVRRNSVPG